MSQASSGTSATSKSHVALPYGAWRCRMVPLGFARWPLALPDSGALPAGLGRARRLLASSCRVSACDLALPGGPGVAGWRSPCPPPPKIFSNRGSVRSAQVLHTVLQVWLRSISLCNLRDVSIVVTNRVGQRCKFRKSSQPQIGSWRSEPFQLRAGRFMRSCIPCASFPTSPFSMVLANDPRGSLGPRG